MLGFFDSMTVNLDGHPLSYTWKVYAQDRFEHIIATGLRNAGPVPKHIAFCMDGNRRFAKQNSMEAGKGHVAGFESMMKILLTCYRLGVKSATVYAFSIENFNRAPEESEVLFNLVRTRLWDVVINHESAVNQFGWRIKFPGNRSLLESDIKDRIEAIESLTAQGTSMVVNICAPYTTRDDLAHSMQCLMSQQYALRMKATFDQGHGEMPPISMVSFDKMRYMSESEDLDIFVRTSGETRFSDFMVWEAGPRCMFEFVPDLWPDFTALRLLRIVAKWQFRQTSNSSSLTSLEMLPPAPPSVSVSKKAVKRYVPGEQQLPAKEEDESILVPSPIQLPRGTHSPAFPLDLVRSPMNSSLQIRSLRQ